MTGHTTKTGTSSDTSIGTPPSHTDVLIVGAGPTGLLLAGDLAAVGVSVTVLERRPQEISNLSRAFGVHARTLEQLDARGLADDLVATGHPLDAIRAFQLLSIDLSRLPSRFPFLLVTPQYEVERILERRAREAGVRFEYGAELTALRQDRDGVEADVRAADSTVTSHRATYVVGTDGHRSAVRSALGLPFPGHAVIKSIVLADVLLADKPEGLLTVNGTGDAFAFIAPFGDGWYRVMGWDRLSRRHDTDPVDLDEVRDITRRALGTDYGMHDARWLSRFHSDERQAPAYRVGRVFLAGDAAHVHSPAGGQGMNTGLQDAANLSWKLAAVLQGRASDALLDTYQAERHPVGRLVLRSSGGIIRLAMAHNALQHAARDLLSTLVTHVRPLNRKAVGIVTGIGISYAPAEPGAHPLVGKRAPDVRLSGPSSRLYEALRAGKFVLITPIDQPLTDARVILAAWSGDRSTTLLVRPDGYIAWASDRPDLAGLAKALDRWTGPAI